MIEILNCTDMAIIDTQYFFFYLIAASAYAQYQKYFRWISDGSYFDCQASNFSKTLRPLILAISADWHAVAAIH